MVQDSEGIVQVGPAPLLPRRSSLAPVGALAVRQHVAAPCLAWSAPSRGTFFSPVLRARPPPPEPPLPRPPAARLPLLPSQGLPRQRLRRAARRAGHRPLLCHRLAPALPELRGLAPLGVAPSASGHCPRLFRGHGDPQAGGQHQNAAEGGGVRGGCHEPRGEWRVQGGVAAPAFSLLHASLEVRWVLACACCSEPVLLSCRRETRRACVVCECMCLRVCVCVFLSHDV